MYDLLYVSDQRTVELPSMIMHIANMEPKQDRKFFLHCT